MGISSDGQLHFGWDIGEDYDECLTEVEIDRASKGGFSDWFTTKVRELAGIKHLPEPSDEEWNAKWEKDEAFTQAWRDIWAAERKADEDFPVKLEIYCSYDYPMYILAIPGTEIRVSRGDITEVDPAQLASQVTPEQIGEARAALEVIGIKVEGEPKWLLSSLYG